jgi:N-acetylglutamate synthase-like GNAT family acetyltransferase
MTVEVYQEKDVREVADLILGIQRDEFSIPITISDQPDLLQIESFYQKGSGNFWVARSEDQLVGTIALLDIGNNQGALRKMFVAKGFRGKEFGVGQKLIDHLIAWVKQKGVQEIYLGTTEKFLAAQRFYEKNGFLEVGKSELPKAFPVMDVDVKFYRLSTAQG